MYLLNTLCTKPSSQESDWRSAAGMKNEIINIGRFAPKNSFEIKKKHPQEQNMMMSWTQLS